MANYRQYFFLTDMKYFTNYFFMGEETRFRYSGVWKNYANLS
jgi:hypothetical protein